MRGQTGRRRYGVGRQARILQKRQVDQPDAILEQPDRVFCHSERDRRLSDATSANNRHEA